MKTIRMNNRICVEGRDIASKILAKNPKYDLAFILNVVWMLLLTDGG